MASVPCSLIAAFLTGSSLSTPKCRSRSKATAWRQNFPALRSISPAPIISGLSHSAPTSPVSFASTLSIRISFLPTTCRGCSPADSASYVLLSRRSETLSGEIHTSPPAPLRTSTGHRQPRSLPHRKSRRPRSPCGPPQRPYRGNGGLSARRPRRTSLPWPDSTHPLDVSRSRPRLHFLQLWRALHAQCRQRARRNRRRDPHSRPRTS